MMDRRAFLGVLGVLAAPLRVEAQHVGQYRFGILSPAGAPQPGGSGDA
jgi:hypothetical protein